MLVDIKKYIALIRILAQERDNKSFVRQLVEMSVLFVWSRLGPGYYLLARMYRREVMLGEILGYLSVRQYNKRVFALNNRLYHRSSQNKVIEKAILTAYGQPTPELLGHYREKCGFTINGNTLQKPADMVDLLLHQRTNDKLCFKLTEAWGGEGFRAIQVLGEGRVRDLSDEQELMVDAFVESLTPGSQGGILVERYLDQHPAYGAFNESSVNTLRVFVVIDGNGDASCIGAFLRVGCSGSLVDNLTAGGITFPVDIETGKLGQGCFRDQPGMYFDHHPETGELIVGRELPLIEDALELAKSSLLAFPETRFVGADIAMSLQGPVVLELNVQPDYNGFAYMQTPSKTALAL